MSNMTDDSALVRAAEMGEEKPADPDETIGPGSPKVEQGTFGYFRLP